MMTGADVVPSSLGARRNTFELSGVCTVVPGSRKVTTSVDLRPEIYRGDLIMIEGMKSSLSSNGAARACKHRQLTNQCDDAAGRRCRVSTRVASSGPSMPKPLIHMRERGALWSAATDPPPPNSSASQTYVVRHTVTGRNTKK